MKMNKQFTFEDLKEELNTRRYNDPFRKLQMEGNYARAFDLISDMILENAGHHQPSINWEQEQMALFDEFREMCDHPEMQKRLTFKQRNALDTMYGQWGTHQRLTPSALRWFNNNIHHIRSLREHLEKEGLI